MEYYYNSYYNKISLIQIPYFKTSVNLKILFHSITFVYYYMLNQILQILNLGINIFINSNFVLYVKFSLWYIQCWIYITMYKALNGAGHSVILTTGLVYIPVILWNTLDFWVSTSQVWEVFNQSVCVCVCVHSF